MKITIPRPSASRSGFTLVELLVVMAIIALLAAVVTAGAAQAINAAKRAKANNQANQIQTAVINYYTEYGVYPVPAGTTTDVVYSDTDQGDWTSLMYALCGNVNASKPQAPNNDGTVSNTRNIAFMTPKPGDVDTNGIVINPFFTTTTATNNHGYFYIAIDADYSGILGDSGGVLSSMPSFTTWRTGTAPYPSLANGITQGVAVWADCDSSSLPPHEQASTQPNFCVRTY